MKKIIISILAIYSFCIANAQTTQTFSFNMNQDGLSVNNMNNLPEQIKLEDVLAELTYDYSFLTDTTDLTKVKNQMMLLQVGARTTKYFDYKAMLIDSLLLVTSAEEIIANPAKYAKGESIEIYKNYPIGKITTIDKISLDWIRCIEDLPRFTWDIKEETKEILGYNCRRAEWTYGGRAWTAWYTEEIPVGVGPWKLDGLPGAIVEASDTQGHYTFKLIGVKMSPNRKMTLTDTKFHNASIKEYYKAKRRFIENPLGSINTGGMQVTIIDQNTGKPMKESDLNRKMKYDFIER